MTDLQITVQGAGVRPPGPGPEPCELCGTSLVCIDVAELLRGFCGLEPTLNRRPSWMEQHVTQPAGPADPGALQMRPHTAARCARVRAGDAEPWAPIEDVDDEDDEDDEDG